VTETAGPKEARPAITIADEALAELRVQIRALLGLVDTGCKPDPAGVIPPGSRNAGPVWKPAPKWKIRTIDEGAGGGPECVYVTTPADWEGDFQSLTVDEARALAMSLLAACDWAESGAPERKRYKELDEDDRNARRTFICGPRQERNPRPDITRNGKRTDRNAPD
jgi:hypothetical protein